MKEINVSIYGGNNIFGGKPTKAQAEILSCNSCDKCDIYKRGRCVNGRKFLGKSLWCSEGRVTVADGYTPRAQKYREFIKKYMDKDIYNAVKSSDTDTRVAYIGDKVYINMPYVHCETENEHIVICSDSLSVHTPSFIDKEQFNAEFICLLLRFKPLAAFEHKVIKTYAEQYVPEFIEQLKKYYPDKYSELIAAAPEYADIKFDYTGRIAYISTLADGCIVPDTDNNLFVFSADNMTLVCENYRVAFKKMLFNKQNARVVIDVTEDMVCEITDNAQVGENTRFCEE